MGQRGKKTSEEKFEMFGLSRNKNKTSKLVECSQSSAKCEVYNTEHTY